MIVNFKAYGISRGVRKLAWTLTLIKKKGERERERELKPNNSEGCSLSGQISSLLSRDHRFESHKPQGY